MNEADAVAMAGPFTRASLCADLVALGLPEGSTVIVHSSLSRLGWIAGGPQAVVLALLDTVGPSGTVVMPTHSGHLSDPAGWENPAVSESWWPVIRSATPPYDQALTPTRGMGAIVECFRHHPGLRRSDHPTLSFAAVGPNRDAVVGGHPLDDGLGEGSPLSRRYELDACLLLLAVDHAHNTSLHLAEYRAEFPGKRRIPRSSPVSVDGVRRWVEWRDLDLDLDDSDFAVRGEAFAERGGELRGLVGAGISRLMSQRAVVDFAVTYLTEERRRRR